MKYLARVCTSALTLGFLMVAGSATVSANQTNNTQSQSNNQKTTAVAQQKTYPLYHFHNAKHGLNNHVMVRRHVHHFHFTATRAAKPAKVAKAVKVVKPHKVHRTRVAKLAANSNYSENNNQNQSQNSNKTYSYKGQTYNTADSYRAAKFTNTKLYKLATSKLGDPYVWGGNGPQGFDCSGFTKYIYKNAKHINLPRLAGDQYTYEKPVSYANIKPGNLVFFGAAPSAISHVGMYIGNGNMIDAQLRGVVIEKVIAPWWHLVGCAKVVRNYRY